MKNFLKKIFNFPISAILISFSSVILTYYIDDYKNRREKLNEYIIGTWISENDIFANPKNYEDLILKKSIFLKLEKRNGIITGKILSKELCDNFIGAENGLIYSNNHSFIDWFFNPKFYLEQQHVIKTVKDPSRIVIEVTSFNQLDSTLTIQISSTYHPKSFEIKNKSYPKPFSETITFIRDDTSFDNLFQKTNNYCHKVAKDFLINKLKKGEF